MLGEFGDIYKDQLAKESIDKFIEQYSWCNHEFMVDEIIKQGECGMSVHLYCPKCSKYVDTFKFVD